MGNKLVKKDYTESEEMYVEGSHEYFMNPRTGWKSKKSSGKFIFICYFC